MEVSLGCRVGFLLFSAFFHVQLMENFGIINDDFLSSLPKENWWGDLDLYQVDGYWFRLPYLQGTHNFLKHFNPLPNDVILASFPKTGTTWLKSLLFSIINRSSKHSLISNHPHELVPSLELQVYGPNPLPPNNVIDGSSARIFSTHLPYHFLAKSALHQSENKVVYVTRNPKDALVSLWHFVGKAKLEAWPLELAVDKFCSGVLPYGPYYDHVLGYRKQSLERPQKVFFITYEELKSDTKNQVKRLAEFLGCPFENEEGLVEEIVKSCSIDTLKKHEVNKSSELPSWFVELPSWFELPYNSFFRQGDVGDFKNYLSFEMIERMDAVTREKFNGSGFMFGV